MSAANRGATFECSGFYQGDSLKPKNRLRDKRGENYDELLVKLWLVLNYTEAKKGRGLPEISKLGATPPHSDILYTGVVMTSQVTSGIWTTILSVRVRTLSNPVRRRNKGKKEGGNDQ